MARKQFYYHEKGNHEENWYYLVKGADGRAYVEHEYSGHPGGGDVEIAPAFRMSVSEFLARGGGTAQDNLLRLIARVTED